MLQRVIRQFSTRISLIPGDGIGPEVADSVVKVFDAVQAPVTWETLNIMNPSSTTSDMINYSALDTIRETKVGLKGPTTTPIGGGHTSINVLLRKQLDLYANVRPCKSVPNISKLYPNVNLVTIRENTEGEYSGKEHQVIPGVIENLKIVSTKACIKIAEYAFEYAKKNDRKLVTALHKANVMKLGDGLFLKICRQIAEKYPEIEYNEKNVDSGCGLLVLEPEKFDVMLMPNLYGDIVSDIGAGLIGGLGLTPSGNIGQEVAIFEAVHGSAPDIAGKNLANPTALLLSSVMMLRHIDQFEKAERVENAIFSVLSEGNTLTKDLGGSSTTSQFTNAIISRL